MPRRTLGFLIAARAFQGIGGALIILGWPSDAYQRRSRPRARTSLGNECCFYVFGGVGWPNPRRSDTRKLLLALVIFYVNVPLGIIGVTATLIFLKEDQQRTAGRFDPPGALLPAVGLIALTLGLSFGKEWGWNSPTPIATLLISVIAFALLVFVEHSVTDPIIDFQLLHNHVFISANISLIMSLLALFAVSFMLPFYLEENSETTQSRIRLCRSLPFPWPVQSLLHSVAFLADKMRSTLAGRHRPDYRLLRSCPNQSAKRSEFHPGHCLAFAGSRRGAGAFSIPLI